MLLVVDALHVGVEPHLASAERGVAVALQRDAVDGVAGEEVALCAASLDEDVAEVDFLEYVLPFLSDIGVERHLDDLRLAVGVGREVHHARSRLALRHVILSVACAGGHAEALDVVGPLLSVAIDEVEDRAVVVLLEDLDVEDVLADEDLVLYLDDLVLAVAVEDDDVVDIGAVLHQFRLFQSRADEAGLAVDVEFLVALRHLGRDDRVETLDLRLARMVLAILLLEHLKPLRRDACHLAQVLLDAGYLGPYLGDQFLVFVLRELGDALHLDLQQAQQVLAPYCAHEARVERLQSLVDVGDELVRVLGVLERLALIDALLDEDLLQRGKEELLLQLVAPDLQFLAQQFLGVVHVAAQYVADGEKLWFLPVDDAAVGRDVDLAVCEGIEGVDGLVARRARGEVHLYLHLRGGHVVHASDLQFALLHGLGDGVLHALCRLRERHLADDECLRVELLYLRPHLDHAAPLSVVVARGVDAAARGEVGVEAEGLAAQVAHGGVADLVEVVGKDLRRQADGNALRALGQEERKLHGERHGLLVASVVGVLPLGGLRVEDRLQRKLRQACLDVAGCGRAVACEDVAPVALRVDEQVFLAELHEGVADGGVAMGVKLHRVAHDIGHLVVASVVHALHRVEDAPLHGLQAVADGGHGTFQDHIARIVEKPVFVHPRQVVYGRCVKTARGAVVAMAVRCLLAVLLRGVLLVVAVYSLVVVHDGFVLLVCKSTKNIWKYQMDRHGSLCYSHAARR